ncbi:terminase large subunit [Arthrobacter phage Ottawa]|nr:terminase large subunit [Arthrobacter phage Kharcho]WIC89309.1 terminase large subunit [Arthrobacter phage Ottawa]
MEASYLEKFTTLPESRRRAIVEKLNQQERAILVEWLEERKRNPLNYVGRPLEFIEQRLGETVWSKQREILQSLVDNKRTAVSACHAPGKSFLAARIAAYWSTVYPAGTTKVISTSTTFRQVKNVLWPHIRRLQTEHELPGRTIATEWKIGGELVAEGIKPPDNSEASLNGYHSPNMLIIVDEAGGIAPSFGRDLEALTTGMNTKMLILGNPPVDEEGTWFEGVCNSPLYHHIEISALDTPNFTGEETGQCGSCPPGVPPHPVAHHLVDRDWVEGLRSEFGEDSAFYQARVLAKFPRDNSAKALPISWLEMAMQNDLDDAESGRIRLGVDIAADGGDEFVIAKADGPRVGVIHRSMGADNENSMVVAAKVKDAILEAEEEHRRRGISDQVRVKLDTIGVGWGVVGVLKQWQKERVFRAEIIGVNVAEKARDSAKFANQRAEMWWNMRTLIQPADGEQQVRLDIDMGVLKQLNGPQYHTSSSGKIQIEKKSDMKARGVGSPDRAEACLLAVFEPPVKKKTTNLPVNLGQSNPWSAL